MFEEGFTIMKCFAFIDIEIDLAIAYYFHLNRWEQNEHFRFGALLITFPKLQIIMSTIHYYLLKA